MRSIALVAIFFGTVGFLDRQAPISMRVVPHTCQAPCTVRIEIHIAPHPLNRWYAVVLDGEMYQSSVHELEGDLTGPIPGIEFRDLPTGEYVVVALLYRQATPSEAGRIVQRIQVG